MLEKHWAIVNSNYSFTASHLSANPLCNLFGWSQEHRQQTRNPWFPSYKAHQLYTAKALCSSNHSIQIPAYTQHINLGNCCTGYGFVVGIFVCLVGLGLFCFRLQKSNCLQLWQVDSYENPLCFFQSVDSLPSLFNLWKIKIFLSLFKLSEPSPRTHKWSRKKTKAH